MLNICMAVYPMVPERRGKIDRTLGPSVAGTPETASTTVTFLDSWGEPEQTFCFHALGLPGDFAPALATAFRGHYAGLASETRATGYKHLRYLAQWLAADKRTTSLAQFDTAAFARYLAWLETYRTATGEPLSVKGRRMIATATKTLLLWIQRHHPQQLAPRLAFPALVGEAATDRTQTVPALTEADLKAILNACYHEIHIAWARFTLGQRVLTTEADITDIDPVLAHLIRQLSRLARGTVPTRNDVNAAGISSTRLYTLGGLRALAQYLHLTGDTLAPFFVALAIQTGANPEALRRLRRNCLVPHPLDEHRVIVEWDKPRAGIHLKRVQRRSFDMRLPHAAPGLIEQLLTMTAPCVALARPQDQDRLFVIKAERGRGISTIPTETLKAAVRRFVARANRRIAAWNEAHPAQPTPCLPPFTLSQLRGSVASAHYVATGGDIQQVQSLLNHQHSATTDHYIGGEAATRVQQQTVARLQQLMVAWVTAPASAQSPFRRTSGSAAQCFSHRCLNPFAPPEGRAREGGELCPGFMGCLACPGLVIPLDAEHLARLLAAKARLEAAREHLDPLWWQVLYGPTYQAITEVILPDFPPDLYPAAQVLLPTLPPLIDLE